MKNNEKDLRIKLARLAGRNTGKLINEKINKIIKENKKKVKDNNGGNHNDN